MAKFEAKVKATLDTSELDQQLKNIKDTEVKVKIDTGSSSQDLQKVNQQAVELKKSLNIGSAAVLTAKGIQLISKASKDAVQAVKNIDQSITNLRMATGQSYQDTAKLVKSYNDMGKTMGATTVEVSDSADAWLRQGQNIKETNELIRDSMILSKVANLESADSTTYLTSAMKGYQVAANNVISIVDKLTAVDLVSATSAGGLAEAMSRTAVSANMTGISMDKLLGYLAVTGEVTQKSMDSVGESFKTIFTRMADIKANKLEFIDEDGTKESLSQVETVLNALDIKLRDSNLQFRNFGDVLDEVAANWGTYSNVQQAAISKAFAGTRQSENFKVLMENYQTAQKYMETSINSTGTAEKKFEAYTDSIEAKTKSLQAAFESLAFNAISSELVGGLTESATAVVEFLDKTNTLKGALAGISAAGTIKGFTVLATGISNAAIRMNQFNSALSILKGGNIADGQLQQLATLTQNLSQNQMKAVLSSKALTAQQRISILTAQGMSAAEAQSAVSAMGLAAAEGTATAATFSLTGAFKGLLATMAANPLLLITAGITAAVAAYSSYKQHMENLRTEAEESARSFDDAKSSMGDYISQIQDLRDKLDSGNLSESEAYETKKQLLDIQNQLNETYGNSVAGLDLVNDKLDEQIDKMRELTALEASKYLNKNAEAIATAEKQMTKTLGGEGGLFKEAGTYLGQFYDNSWDDTAKLKEILGQYGDFIQLDNMQDGMGTIRIRFVGDAKDAKSVLNDLMTDLRYASSEFKDSSLFDDIFSGASVIYKDADEIIQKYETVFETAKQARLIEESYSNAKKTYSENGIDKTAVEWLDDYTNSVKEYNNALLSGDTSKIADTKSQFDKLDASIKNLIANDEGFAYFSSMFDDVRASLNDSAISANHFGDSLKRSREVDFLKDSGITNVQFADAFISGLGSDQTSRAVKHILQDYANAFGVDFGNLTTDQVEWVADYLVKAGYLIRENTEDLQESISDSLDADETAATSAIDFLSKAQELLSAQKAGHSISLEDFNSDEMKQYLEALEYSNGVYQLNAEKVYALASAQAELAIQTNIQNKALKQSEYLENAKQIDVLNQQLKNLDANETDSRLAIEAEIDSLREKNIVIRKAIDEYGIMNASLQAAYSSYQHWINAQNSADFGDLFGSTVTAIDQIKNTIENTGNFGSLKYKAALDLIIPDSVDKTDVAAVQNYIQSINKYLSSENGKVTGMNLSAFLEDSQNAGLMNYDAAADRWDIAPGIKLDDFAKQLNLAEGMVNAFFDEIQLKGGDISFADEIIQTFGDIAMKAYDAKDSIKETFGEQYHVAIDVSNIETTQGKLDALDATIAEMDSLKATPGIDASQIQNANDVIQYAIQQKQLLTEPAIMKVDASQVQGGLSEAIGLLQQFQSLSNQREILIALGLDTSGVDAQISEVSKLIQTNETIKADLQIDTTSVDSIASSIKNIDVPAMVEFGVDASAIDGYNPDTKQVDVIYNPNDSALPTSFDSVDRTVNYIANTSDLPSSFDSITCYVNYVATGNVSVNGTAHAAGTAMAGGNWGTAAGGQTLVGELGREIVVDPKTGRWYTVGDKGAEFRNIPAGAIVFNHKQTESLLENGYVAGRARALVNGTAMVSGGISGSYVKYTAPSSGGATGSTSSTQTTKSNVDKEKTDWIAIAIDRIEREIKKLSNASSSAFDSLKVRLAATKDSIALITKELSIQQQAQQRYLAEANNVKLSDSIKKLVRDGAIDIGRYDEDTQKLIEDYQKWYEAFLDCSDAVDKLKENLAELYQDAFDASKTNAENQIGLIDHVTSSYQSQNDLLAEKGYLSSAKLYSAMIQTESQKIITLQSELADLESKFNSAMASGEIEKDSEAYYDMLLAINGVKEALNESSIAVQKYANTIRNIKWEYFDFLQERISSIGSETDYLIDLLGRSKLFDDNGIMTDNGSAVAGLRAQNYNVFMAQSDAYAKEIKQIDKDIAQDPYNTDLIKRREELLKLQQQSIIAAENEKQAIVDLTKDGIDLQLKSMTSLIDKYKSTLDSAKDLYDYQKKVRKQSDTISNIKKQISAYSGNDSEEAKAKLQKLTVELKNAQDDLEETEYQKYVTDQKQLLDNLYSEYESVLNQRLDDVSVLVQDVINATNNNAANINQTITKAASDVGYTVSDYLKNIWNGSGITLDGTIVYYSKEFGTLLTGTNNILNSISYYVSAMASNSDSVGAVKKYTSGGLADYTGLAQVDGTPSKPEIVLSPKDTQNFLELRNLLRNVDMKKVLYDNAMAGGILPKVQTTGITQHPLAISSFEKPEVVHNTTINLGGINIDHVEDYDDLVTKMREDHQFEKMIQSMTVDRIAGGSSLKKYQYRWK